MAGKLVAPAEWKASWRKNMRWGGLAKREYVPRAYREYKPSTVGELGLPVVCFTGAMPRSRKEMMAEAEASGWEAHDKVHSMLDVLVTADPNGTSNKLQYARQNQIPILSLDEWELARVDGELPDDA